MNRASAAMLLHEDAVPLAHALVAGVAAQLGARALIIKGPVSAEHGLRAARVSADADVWVHPADFASVQSALHECGWGERSSTELGRALSSHSTTLIHPDWPCDIDLHRAFPGFLAPTADVFDALWARRQALSIAGQPVHIPDWASSVLILGLHSLRAPSQARRMEEELWYVLSDVLPATTEEQRADLLELATSTVCVDTARAMLEPFTVLPPPMPPGVSSELDAWRARTTGRGLGVVQMWLHVGRAPWRAKAKILRELVWRPEAEFRLEHPEVGPGRMALNRGRLARLRRGVSGMPTLVRATLTARLGMTDRSIARTSRGPRRR